MQDKKLNVLLFGGISALNSSIIDKLSVSQDIGEIYTINANQTFMLKIINLGSGKKLRKIELKKFIKEKNIDFVIIFSEGYSATGVIDYYKQAIPIIGVTKEWFKIEESKLIGKEFMIENGIKTPNFEIINDKNNIDSALKKFGLPIVIKRNTLQRGFGSYICHKECEYKKLAKQFLKQDKICIAEQFIKGEEITQTYIWDTETLIPLNPVKDYKRLKEGDKGINTGSLGSYTPVELTKNQEKLLDIYNKKMKSLFESLKPDFTGIFCTNIMFSQNEIYTLEFNMRPGVPEFETLIENMDVDILDFFYKISKKQAKDINIKYKSFKTGCIVVVHKDYQKQKLNELKKVSLKQLFINKPNNVKIYLNGSYIDNNCNFSFETNKMLYTLLSTDINPFQNIYKFINSLETKNLYYRKDIGE